MKKYTIFLYKVQKFKLYVRIGGGKSGCRISIYRIIRNIMYDKAGSNLVYCRKVEGERR